MTQRTSWLSHSTYRPQHSKLLSGHLDEVIRTAIENCWGAILVNSFRCKFQDACVLAPLCKSSGGCVTSSAEPAVLALAERPACHSAPSETATELDAAFDLVRSALHKSALGLGRFHGHATG